MANTTFRGFAYGALAAASYGLNPLFTLPLYKEGISPDSVLFYRYALAVVLIGGLMLIRKQSFALHPKEIFPLAVLGVLFSVSSLTLFLSYHYMDAGIASTILFIYPVLVAVIMALFFKEKVSLVTICSILLATSGIALLYKGEGNATLSLFGVLLVFVSSLTYAIYIVGVNHSILRDMDSLKLTFYSILFGSVVYVIRTDFCLELDVIHDPVHWLNPIGLALFPTFISLVAMTKSIHYIGSTPAAILGALEPITALIIGVCVFGEAFTPRIMLGILLILAGVTLIIAGRSLIKTIRIYVLHR